MKKKRTIRKMRQDCCKVDNYQRMSLKAGEKASKKAEQLAEDMLRVIIDGEPGVHGAVVAATAVAMVRSYIRKALCGGIGFDAVKCMEELEELFESDCWMRLHNDLVLLDVENFISGNAELIKEIV